jgi:hypothetical protein
MQKAFRHLGVSPLEDVGLMPPTAGTFTPLPYMIGNWQELKRTMLHGHLEPGAL